MEQLNAFQITVMSISLMIITVNVVNGQISTPCTAFQISSFTPCANIITGSTNNGSIPSNTCCDSLRSLASTSLDCACLIISANVPFPIGGALALSLVQACNMNGLPAQCKATGSPLRAPGPASFGPNNPTLPPTAASPLSPQASKAMAVLLASKSEDLQAAPAPALPAVQAEAPTRTPEILPVLTPRPSASNPSYVSLSPLALLFIGIVALSL